MFRHASISHMFTLVWAYTYGTITQTSFPYSIKFKDNDNYANMSFVFLLLSGCFAYYLVFHRVEQSCIYRKCIVSPS